MEKGPKQQSFEIRPTHFQNDGAINDQLENTGKSLVALHLKLPLQSVVYPISQENGSYLFNFFIHLSKAGDG